MLSTNTTIWLARHGEVNNPSNVLYGRLPRMRLSPEGCRQAQALADFLTLKLKLKIQARPLAAIYSSPMLRARRTASIVQASHPEVERVRIDSDLHEVRTGWQGEPLDSLQRIDWDFYTHPREAGDESLHAIQERMSRWLKRMLRRHAGSDVLGVSHGDPILILVGSLRGVPLDRQHLFPRPYIPPGVVYRMRFDAHSECQDIQLLVPHTEAAA